MAVMTDALLVRCQLAAAGQLRRSTQRWCAAAGLRLAPTRLAWSAASQWAYFYAQPPAALEVGGADLLFLTRLWNNVCPDAVGADVSRLELVQHIPGYSQGAVPVHHYAVETDPESGWGEEIARWYVEEHMPGLAAVPGCIAARRFVNHDSGPRSHACYALESEAAMGSEPWLAVRGTAWSSRVRPHFTNTRRTMMAVMG